MQKAPPSGQWLQQQRHNILPLLQGKTRLPPKGSKTLFQLTKTLEGFFPKSFCPPSPFSFEIPSELSISFFFNEVNKRLPQMISRGKLLSLII